MWKLAFLILLLAAPVFAQLENHTLTISTTRSITLQPDQVVFGLTVGSSPTANLDQIVAALSGLGVTSAGLTGVSNSPAFPLQWNFTLPVPLSNLSARITSLTKLQQTIAQNNSGLTLTFTINGAQVSQQLRQSQSCSNSDMIAEATAQGQKLAAPAGLTLGPILKLSNTPLVESSVPVYAGAIAGRLGAFVQIGAFAELLLLPAPSPVTCALVVKFQLLP